LFLFVFVLCPVLPISLDCPFVIALRFSLTFFSSVDELQLPKWEQTIKIIQEKTPFRS
jgi:hypothetical protein